MKQVPFSVVRDDLDEFLDGVERGETFVITRYGKPVARMEPAEKAPPSPVELRRP
jgi:antitoxin (DNA-binding transcriptional repressor) of toxin-antitoxin stability system